jgi:O-antigen ligase
VILNKTSYVPALLYLMIFINAMGVQFPFYNIFTFNGINLFIVPYSLIVIITIIQKDFFHFIKKCKICIALFYIVLLISLSMIVAIIISLYVLNNPNYSSVAIVIRNIIYASFFIVLPYCFYKYNINIESAIFVWLMAVCIQSFLYYFDNPEIIGIYFYLNGQNILGFYVALSIFFAFYFTHKFYEKNNFIKMAFYGSISLFLLITSLFTWSKSSWVSIIISLFFVLLINTFKRKKVFFLFLILTIISSILILNIDFILGLVVNEWSASSGSNSNEERLGDIIAGLKIFLYSFTLGVGPKNYPIAIEYYAISDVLWVQPDPHNSYIHILAEYGLLAFICFFSMVYIVYKKLNLYNLLDLYLFGALISILIFGNFSGQVITQQFLFIFFSLIVGYSIRKIEICKK